MTATTPRPNGNVAVGAKIKLELATIAVATSAMAAIMASCARPMPARIAVKPATIFTPIQRQIRGRAQAANPLLQPEVMVGERFARQEEKNLG
ncbi:MAG: hypothetical protein U1E15_07305 [Hyphomicrobiales bacterium]